MREYKMGASAILVIESSSRIRSSISKGCQDVILELC